MEERLDLGGGRKGVEGLYGRGGRGWLRWRQSEGGGKVIDSSVVVKSACRGGRCVLERAPTPHV